jgi:hypothetical protein
MHAAKSYQGAYWRKVHCCVNILAQEYPSLDIDFLNKIQNGGEQFAAFCLFMGTSPKNCGLLGGKGNTLKLKVTAKLKDKRTSIATVEAFTEAMPPSPTPPWFSLQATFKGTQD